MTSVNETATTSRTQRVHRVSKWKCDDLADDADLNWNLKELRSLYAALKKHGTSNIEALAKEVGTRSPAAVKLYLSLPRHTADKKVVQNKSTTRMSHWLRVMHKPKSKNRRCFDRSIVLVEMMEEFAEQCARAPLLAEDGPQFEDIYRVLQQVMQKHVPAALSPTDVWLLRRLLATVATLLPEMDSEKKLLRQAAARIEVGQVSNRQYWGRHGG